MPGDRVQEALDALGGLCQSDGLLRVACGRMRSVSLRDWALRQGWSGRPLPQGHAQGIAGRGTRHPGQHRYRATAPPAASRVDTLQRRDVVLQQSSMSLSLNSPPGMGRGGLVARSRMPKKPPVHRPPGRRAREVKRGAGPAAPERGAPGLRSPLAPGAARILAHHPLCARAGRRAAGAPQPWSTMWRPSRRPVLFGDSELAGLCKPCHDAKTAREGRWDATDGDRGADGSRG